MLPTIYTKKEAAVYLKCCLKTINNYIITGRLRSTKIGRKRMFTEAHLNEIIKAGEV